MSHIVEIVHRVEFSCAHRLHSPELDEAENRALYGPCFNDHGHNYEMEVGVRGAVSGGTGMVMNLSELSEIVRREFWTHVDHKHLNHDVPFLEGVIPTAENIAVAAWARLQGEIEKFQGCRLHRIRIFESRQNSVEYRGPSPA